MNSNYKVQSSCLNCMFEANLPTYDCPDPLCNKDGSFKDEWMNSFHEMSEDELLERMNWETAHRVSFTGICDDFKKET